MKALSILGIFLNNEMRTGANRRYLELMESLAEKGCRVAVIMNTRLAYEPRHFKRVDITVNYVRKGFPPTSFLFKNGIRAKFPLIASELSSLGMERVDWIHIHGDIHFPSALYLKRRLSAKLFFAFRCNDITRAQILRKYRAYTAKEYALSFAYNAKDRLREMSIARQSDLITFQNSLDRDIFLKRVRLAKRQVRTVIIPGNIGVPRFTAETKGVNRSEAVRSLVYVGSVSLSKGLQNLLEALAILKKRGFAELRLSVLGKISGDEKAFSLVKSLDIAEEVSFEGYVLPFPFLEKADLMVYPTLYDAFPDTILEALHTGCPVIASEIGGIPEILKYPDLLFPLGDSAEIADRIERCVKDTDFYGHLRGLCEERAAIFRFDWADRFLESMHSFTDETNE
jgi:glycosyltransferase involved in cell wall biosynthesis